MKMKIVFFGTTDFAVASLDALMKTEHEVVGVVTNINKLGGRGRKEVIRSAVCQYALQNDLTLLQPATLKGPRFLARLAALEADLFVVVAFRMLPEVVWSMPEKGTINVHGSLLPAYRGAAPINWAIINGEKETGVSVFFLDQKIDTGKILLYKKMPVSQDDTFGSLYEALKELGGEALQEAVSLISRGHYSLVPQNDAVASHAPKLDRSNTRIDFDQTPEQIVNLCRGLDPYPGAWFEWEKSLIKVWKAGISDEKLPAGYWSCDYKTWWSIGCGNGSVNILELQPEGKKRMTIKEFLNGFGSKMRSKFENGQNRIE